MTQRVVITDSNFPDAAIEREILNKAGIDVEREQAIKEDEVVEIAADANGLISQHAQIGADAFEAHDSIEVVGRAGIGVDTVDVEAATDHDIQVVNVPSYCEQEVSTHALSLLLTVSRNVSLLDANVKQGTWDWKIGRSINRLHGSTFGFAGFGKIPQQLVQKTAGFDFDYLGYDPYLNAEEIAEYGVEKASFDMLLAESDFISVHAPLTDETRNMFDSEAFEQMKDSAILINTARGDIVDVDALNKAVRRDEIRGAGLDVMPTEPPTDDDILTDDRIVYTPHAGFYSETSLCELRRTIATEVRRVLNGEDPENPVNDVKT